MFKMDIKYKYNEVSGWYEINLEINNTVSCDKLKTIKESVLNYMGNKIDVAIENKLKEFISEETEDNKPFIYE
jgi:hypothetical protein